MRKPSKNDSLNRTNSPEQPSKRKTFSKRTLAMLATAWTLLFGACSNNPSSWKDYEQKQKIESKIKKQEHELENTEKTKEELKKIRIENAIRHNEKVDEYYFVKSTNPDAEHRLANLEESIYQLKKRVNELDKQIAKLEHKAYKTEGKLIDSKADAAWRWINGEIEKMEVVVR